MTNDADPAAFAELITESRQLQAELKALLPSIAKTRRSYMRSRTDADKAEMDRVQQIAEDLSQRHSSLYDGLRRTSGLPDEVFDSIDKFELPSDPVDRLQRGSLLKENVDITGYIDDHIGAAVEKISSALPGGWLEQQADVCHQLDALADTECLSLVKGLRPESEFPPLHRLRQMLRVGSDYATNVRGFDHFAGATLVPQLVQLGNKFTALDDVGGDVAGRIRKLTEDSASVDSTTFELLVAAGCAEAGRSIEFIEETQEKSPDLRCHDPFPMVIECKRKRVLSDYELEEERYMRAIFHALEREASAKGLYGRFELFLSVEAKVAPSAEIVSRLVSQRLAAHPDRLVDYAWGSVALTPLPNRIAMPPTRLYSPNMLRAAFNWNSDLPEWDGIVCRVRGGAFDIDEVRDPIALVWRNTSSRAVNRRAWSPLDLFGDATNQIPPGEFGLIYLAYHEGARQEIADERVERFFAKLKEWDHAGSIRIPISFLVRLYPRPLDHGIPDMIESTVRLCSAVYGEPRLFQDFPNSVFTNTPKAE